MEFSDCLLTGWQLYNKRLRPEVKKDTNIQHLPCQSGEAVVKEQSCITLVAASQECGINVV